MYSEEWIDRNQKVLISPLDSKWRYRIISFDKKEVINYRNWSIPLDHSQGKRREHKRGGGKSGWLCLG